MVYVPSVAPYLNLSISGSHADLALDQEPLPPRQTENLAPFGPPFGGQCLFYSNCVCVYKRQNWFDANAALQPRKDAFVPSKQSSQGALPIADNPGTFLV